MKNNLSVLKFGGSSVATPEKIQAVATRVADMARAGRRLVIVVSAMGQTTNELLALAHKISPHPNRRELDMLLTTGERISMSLMSMALHDHGCPSISFTGSQAGVMTTGAFSNAEIVDIRPIRVESELHSRRVVVLAGFQGVDPKTKEITTLGRGGSDTTAIAIAAALRAQRCEIYKDVDGVFGADPKIVAQAPLYKTMPLHLLHEFCHWGAKILNARSVAWAMKGNVQISIGRSSDFVLGTNITTVRKRHGYENIIGLHAHSSILEIIVKCRSLADATRTVGTLLKERELPIPTILFSQKIKTGIQMLITLDADTLIHIEHALQSEKSIKVMSNDLSSIAVTQAIGHAASQTKRNPFNGLPAEFANRRFSTKWSDVIIVPTSIHVELMQSIGNAVF